METIHGKLVIRGHFTTPDYRGIRKILHTEYMITRPEAVAFFTGFRRMNGDDTGSEKFRAEWIPYAEPIEADWDQ
jgi:hypothetical protein